MDLEDKFNRRCRRKGSHSLLRPTISLNCKGNPNKWHYCRTSSTGGYSTLRGRKFFIRTAEFSRDTLRANQHHKSISKTVTNERKAIKVLGLMFVACSAVFFCVNFTMGVCPECKFDESFLKYVFIYVQSHQSNHVHHIQPLVQKSIYVHPHLPVFLCSRVITSPEIILLRRPRTSIQSILHLYPSSP